MPISGGKYVAPTWNNGSSPAINAAELQAMCDTIATSQNATFSQLVSYTGTGNYGAGNPCSVTFSKAVDAIFCIGASQVTGYWSTSVAMANESTSYQQSHGFGYVYSNYSYGKKSADNKTYTWYNISDQWSQLNIAGQAYYFLGLSGVA